MLSHLDEFLMKRVFQPMANAMGDAAAPAEAARFCLTGAMVFVLAGMLASAAVALPDWTVLFDLAALWAGMVLLRTLAVVPMRHFNPLRDQFGMARRVLAFITIALWLFGATSIAGTFGSMKCTLWCMALYFASCDPPSRFRHGAARQQAASLFRT